MVNTLHFEDHLDSQDVVLVFQDKDGSCYLGHSFYYGGRDANYLLFMYKDALPLKKCKDLMSSWNYLDDNSVRIVIVGEQSNQIAVEDFLYSHGMARNWKTIHYREVTDFIELNDDFMKYQMQPGEVLGYVVSGAGKVISGRVHN